MFLSFKTVGKLQVIHQPLSRPKQIRAGEYVVGRKIGLERVNTRVLFPKFGTESRKGKKKFPLQRVCNTLQSLAVSTLLTTVVYLSSESATSCSPS
jgi:hypothetical protein